MDLPIATRTAIMQHMGVNLVYAPNRRLAHLSLHAELRETVCGWHAQLGTGSQAEYEHAASLPMCANCAGAFAIYLPCRTCRARPGDVCLGGVWHLSRIDDARELR